MIPESRFRISPRLDFNKNCFKTRKQKEKDARYIVGLKPEMNKKGKLRDVFWAEVERKCADVYGSRSANRRAYRKEHGCYVFTWGLTPIYIGLAKGKNGFYQECFAKHKLEKMAEYFKDRNVGTQKKATQNYLHLYLIFWNGMQRKNLKSIVDEMETFLIIQTAKAGKIDNLYNISKTNFKWGIGGYHGSEVHKDKSGWTKKQKNCLAGFEDIFG